MNYKKNKRGFTLAEVLITLSIIGVIAAILFPSILANYNERTLKAKRQALLGRMSQAMGEMADTFRNYGDLSCTDSSDPLTCTDNGSSLKFINEGLSKVYKISAVCDNESLSACDIPDEITLSDGSIFSMSEKGKTILDFNPQLAELTTEEIPYNINSAAFKTKNGESILLFYHPNCLNRLTYVSSYIYSGAEMCVNMVYDLNGGKNKPNKMGEDVGFMTVFYNDSPYVATARPYDWRGVADYEMATDASGNEVPGSRARLNFFQAQEACAALGENVGLPSREEAMAMQVNRELWAPLEDQTPASDSNGMWLWTSTMATPTYAWMYYFIANNRTTNIHLFTMLYPTSYNNESSARCVYKD